MNSRDEKIYNFMTRASEVLYSDKLHINLVQSINIKISHPVTVDKLYSIFRNDNNVALVRGPNGTVGVCAIGQGVFGCVPHKTPNGMPKDIGRLRTEVLNKLTNDFAAQL